MQFLVAHEGVPIGDVDLPDGRLWAGGLLEPLPAFAALRPILEAAAAGAEVAGRLLTLPSGELPDVHDLAPPLDVAVVRVARLRFELQDAAGLTVAADVVRLADAGDGRGVRVRVYFRSSSATIPAVIVFPDHRGRNTAAPDA